jgi:(2R)-ethylmalonyl-CoA mutase
VVDGLRAAGLDDVPVVVGGIIPDTDAERLKSLGVARVFTPKDFEMSSVLNRVVDAIREAHALT